MLIFLANAERHLETLEFQAHQPKGVEALGRTSRGTCVLHSSVGISIAVLTDLLDSQRWTHQVADPDAHPGCQC